MKLSFASISPMPFPLGAGILAGKKRVTITLGPLNSGTYKFVGERHETAAQSRIVAK